MLPSPAQVEEFLENIIGEKPSACREAGAALVGDQQSIVNKPLDCL